jgi:hypothetical protein
MTPIRVKHLDSDLMRDSVAEQEVITNITSVRRRCRYFLMLTAAHQIKSYMLATIAEARQSPAKESSGIEICVLADPRDTIDECGGRDGGGEEVEGGTGRLLQREG